MTLGTTLYIGPIQAAARNLEPSWASVPDAKGFRSASIKAALPIAQSEQLSELVANADRRITVGGPSGVLEPIWFDGAITRDFNGWYLLQGLSFEPYGTGEWVSHVPVTLSALHLGQRQPIVVRSARPLANSYAIVPKSVVTDPFGLDGSFVSSPGGTHATREFDPEPHDSARVSVVAATQHSYIGAVTTTTDTLGLVLPLAMEMA